MLKINTQPISKKVAGSGASLLVHSVFSTIQGEGPFAGVPAIFFRLGGCNLQCPGCDTEYTEGVKVWPMTRAIEEIEVTAQFDRSAARLVVITGGEPFRQNLGPFVERLLDAGYRIQIETNGTLPPTIALPTLDHITVVCSPKTGRVDPLLERYVTAYKYVLRATEMDDDGLPLTVLGHLANPRVARPRPGFDRKNVYVQPADDQDPTLNAANTQAAIRSAIENNFRFCMQVHKFVNLP